MATPALPNLSLTVTPPGGATTDYTTNLAYSGASQQIAIRQNFGRQGDTATLVLVDDWQGQAHPSFYIPVLSQVSFTDNNLGISLFAGVVNQPTLFVDSANRNEWILNCTDYTYYADNAIVEGTFNGQTVDKIVVALTQQANCGITAATTAKGGFVAPAPSLTTVTFNWTKLSDAWRTLAQLASTSTPYGWYVDEHRRLHFYDASTALSSGATFTTTPTAAGLGSTTEGHVLRDGTFGYTWDGGTIHNRILVQGATQTISPNVKKNPTGIWKSNGVQDAWGLKWTVTSVAKLTVNGVTTKVDVVHAGSTSTSTWQVVQNANGQWFLTTSKVPANGRVIKIWYTYQVPITAQATDHTSQVTYTGPNGGVYSEFIQDSTLTTSHMALARAQRERVEYAFAVERLTFNTDPSFFGWVRSGETFRYVTTLVNDDQAGNTWGLNDTFLCTANTVNFVKGGYRSLNPTGVRI